MPDIQCTFLKILESVHTYPDFFENVGFSLHFRLPCTRNRPFWPPKTEVFEYADQTGGF